MSLANTLCLKCFLSARGENGPESESGQDKLAGKSGITSDEKKGGVVSCEPFPIP